jgi:hypothetical protein
LTDFEIIVISISTVCAICLRREDKITTGEISVERFCYIRGDVVKTEQGETETGEVGKLFASEVVARRKISSTDPCTNISIASLDKGG